MIVDYLRDNLDRESTGIACVFCDHNDQQTQTASSMISSIMKQLVQGQKDFPDSFPVAVTRLHQKHKKLETLPSFAERMKLLNSVVADFSEVFIVIDALDECREGENTRKFVIEGIQALSKDTHIMITSRNLPQIEKELKDWPQLEIWADDGDIQRYLEAHMEDDSDLAEVIKDDQELRNCIIKKIQQMSKGM
jgi:hypothetical protein